MMRFLLISICLFVVGCKSYPRKSNFIKSETIGNIHNPYFANPDQDYVYKANIEVYNKSFGGIFIVKKIEDQNHRIVFTTEMGNKLFDFSFNKDDFKVNYILEEMNKKLLINILKKDFKILITENLQVNKTYSLNSEIIKETTVGDKTYYYFESPKVYKIVRANTRKEKVRFLFKEINDNIARQIHIIHSNIKLKISLKAIH
jgi:hypothetical protein